MCIGVLVAAASISLGPSTAKLDGLSTHVQNNIRYSVGSADTAALVTVMEPVAAKALLRVEEVVMGELAPGQTLDVSTVKFARQDLEPGRQLLVFFTHSGKSKLAATGRYEAQIDGNIRDIPAADYLEANREAASLKPAKAQPVARPAAAGAAAVPQS